MESIENAYRYHDLENPNRQIRLLELLPPDSEGAPVAVKLFHQDLFEPFEYDALSYTWGHPSVTTAIRLDDDINFRMPAKLEAALRDLRLSHSSRIIWIDAIAINQRNANERNQQVQLMRKIYEQASMVKVWFDYEIDPNSPKFVNSETITEERTFEDLGGDPTFWRPVSDIGEVHYCTRPRIQ